METTSQKTRSNPLVWTRNYLHEAREEMHKISWPNKKQIVQYSVAVIAISVIVAAFFAGLDWALTLGLQKLIEMSS